MSTALVFSKKYIETIFIVNVIFIFFVFNYAVQNSILGNYFYHISNFLYVLFLVSIFYFKKDYFLICLIFYFVCFHMYSADPYDESFVSFQSGYYKFVIVCAALFVTIKSVDAYSLAIVALLALSTFYQYIVGDDYTEKYFFNDLVFYFFLVSAVLVRVKDAFKVSETEVYKCIYVFWLLLPLAYAFSYVFELYEILYGSYYFFYGHVFNFILIFGIVYYLTCDRTSVLGFIACIVNLIVLIQSLQSAHIIFVLSAIVISGILSGKKTHFVVFILSLTLVVVVAYYSPDYTWIKLKFTQALSVFSFIFMPIEILSLPNSLAIRLAELYSIIVGNSIVEFFIGNGLGATYEIAPELLANLNLHSATFPPEELESSQFHLIHETIVRIFFQIGIIGLFIYLALFIRALAGKSLFRILIFVFAINLLLSNLQTAGFFSLLILALRNSDYTFSTSK